MYERVAKTNDSLVLTDSPGDVGASTLKLPKSFAYVLKLSLDRASKHSIPFVVFHGPARGQLPEVLTPVEHVSQIFARSVLHIRRYGFR